VSDNVNQRQVRRFPWSSPSGQAIGPAGISADELKVFQGGVAQKLGALNTQPIAQRGPVEFISPSTSSETLRLAVPEAANPYATPTGPKHDHMMIRRALSRSQTDVNKSLMSLLKSPPSNIKPEDADRMRASMARVHSMEALLKPLLEWQDMIYARVIGQNRDV
jgi:hypothetical protein